MDSVTVRVRDASHSAVAAASLLTRQSAKTFGYRAARVPGFRTVSYRMGSYYSLLSRGGIPFESRRLRMDAARFSLL